MTTVAVPVVGDDAGAAVRREIARLSKRRSKAAKTEAKLAASLQPGAPFLEKAQPSALEQQATRLQAARDEMASCDATIQALNAIVAAL